MDYRIMDMTQYKRRAHFDYFRKLTYPYVGTTVSVDVTDLLSYCKRQKRSFYLTFLHAAALAADGVPELRQRIRGAGIIEYAECPTSHVELLPDGTYCYCTLHHHMPLDEYFVRAEDARKRCAENGITEDDDAESQYFISTLPWIHYSALIQPVAGGDESNPRITWGKYETDDKGRALMPVSILIHHALADGMQIAQFYSNLDAEIQKYQTLL
mgnify:CR=1 FL=1